MTTCAITARGLLLLGLLVAGAPAAGLALGRERAPQDISRDLSYTTAMATPGPGDREIKAHLAFFTSRAFRLEVVDLGDGPDPAYPTLEQAFRAHGCLAGVNGGFFHPHWQPAGLVISGGTRINELAVARLLSGVIYSDGKGIHLVRRARFRDHPGITALLQSGPYLVEHGRAVRGLSASDPNRRTFIATDWRGNWVLGATLGPVTLAELADALASTGALVPWRVERALNLDGGSSTGFFFERGEGNSPVLLRPWKRVRNLLGIVPR